MKYKKVSPLILVAALVLSSQGAFAARKIAKTSKKRSAYSSVSYKQRPVYQLAAVTSQTPPSAASPAPQALALPSAGSSVATVEPKSKWIAAYYADFNGPGIGEWGYLSKNPNPGDGVAPLWLYNVGLLGYKLNDTTRIQVQPRFRFQVVNPMFISMMDTRVGFNFSKLGKLGPISLDGVSAQVEVPTSDSSFKSQFIVGPRLTETISAQWGAFGLSSYNIQRYRFSANAKNQYWDIYFNPAATYDIAPWITAKLGYEFQFGQEATGAPVSMFMSDVKAQAVLNISNTWSFEPYVKMFPYDGLYSDNTLVGFEVNGLFF